MVTGRTDNGASKPRGPPCDPLRAVTPLWSAFVRALSPLPPAHFVVSCSFPRVAVTAVKNRHAVLVKKQARRLLLLLLLRCALRHAAPRLTPSLLCAFQAKPEKPRTKKRKSDDAVPSPSSPPAAAAVAPPPKLPPVRTTVAQRRAQPAHHTLANGKDPSADSPRPAPFVRAHATERRK